MEQLVSILGVPHDPTLPAPIGRGGQEPDARAAELIDRQRTAFGEAQFGVIIDDAMDGRVGSSGCLL